MGAEETKVIRACEYCAYAAGRNSGYAACPKGMPTCSVFNGYYKFKPAAGPVVEGPMEPALKEPIKMCCDCAHYELPYSSTMCRTCTSRRLNWKPVNVTVQERVEKALNEVCDKVDALEDVSNQPHYTRFKIQPIEFIKANGLGYLEGNVIKYVCRYPYKGTPLKDLYKAKDYIEHLIREAEAAS